MDKPNALVITRNLPPHIGGMERLIWHVVNELAIDYRLHVIGPTACKKHLSSNITVSEVPIRPLFNYFLRTAITTIGIAVRFQPQLIFAGSGLTAPFAWLAARLTGKRCIVYLHGLDIEAAHPIYRILWLPFIRNCDKVIVNSKFTFQLALDVGVTANKLIIVHPGVDLPDFSDAQQKKIAFRQQHRLNGVPILLYVGRITARKGLAKFISESLPVIVEKEPSIKLVVIGDEATNALLKNTGELARIEEILIQTGLMNSVLFLGELPKDSPDLDAAYFAADVSIFPIQYRANDNEGFGMVAIEAAAHGLPTVAFDVGGVRDAVKEGVSGNLIKPGDHLAFANAVCKLLRMDQELKITRIPDILNFAEKFAWQKFGEKIRLYCQADV